MSPQPIDRRSPSESDLVEDLEALIQRANQRSSVRTKLSRAGNIVRYYRASQLLARALRTVAPALGSRSIRTLATPAAVPQPTPVVRPGAPEIMRRIAATRLPRTTASRQTLCGDLSRGRFTLLREPRELGWPIDWSGHKAPHPSRLWSFQLQYHEYLLDLAVGSAVQAAADDDAKKPAKKGTAEKGTAKKKTAAAKETTDRNMWPLIWQVVADWIDNHPLAQALRTDDAWHPYCLSRRLPTWAQLFALSEPPGELRDRFLQSFACQAEVLSKRLEFDLGGNHLLENLSALAWAGAFLEGLQSDRWLALATRQLRQQLPLQLLPHGEHYERAAMYHCQVLGNLLQAACATAAVRADLAELCRHSAGRMHAFLRSILHPDGEIPLFGDSCWGETHSVSEINALANLANLADLAALAPTANNATKSVGNLTAARQQSTDQAAATPAAPPATQVSGPYWVYRTADEALIFDAGAVGASDLPAHAHCDLLGFEASLGGRRWFVDSGLFDYEASPMRDYCRASAAHNVVTVDHQSCCDVWSRFRMGRRGRATKFSHGEQGRFAWCQAGHDGYRHLGIAQMSRLLVMHNSGVWTCLEHATGGSPLPLVGRLHLAPGIALRRTEAAGPQGRQQMVLTSGTTQRWLTVTAGVELGLAAGWYCDRFGQRTQTQVITYRPPAAGGAGCTFGWSLSASAETFATVRTLDASSRRLQLTIAGDPELFDGQFSG